ncbi:MAG: hypothetical protein ABFR33_11725 [Verrucomicrobiota bacterium]
MYFIIAAPFAGNNVPIHRKGKIFSPQILLGNDPVYPWGSIYKQLWVLVKDADEIYFNNPFLRQFLTMRQV